MEALKNLRELIHSLNHEELRIARIFLQVFDPVRDENSRAIVLFDVLRNRHIPLTDKEVLKAIYSGENIERKTLYRLCSRVKDRILESLTIDLNLTRKDAYCETDKIKLQLRKKTVQANILLSKGMGEQAVIVYNVIIDKAREIEAYDELIETLLLKRRYTGLQNGKEAYAQFADEIAFYESCRAAVATAQDLYHQVSINKDFSGRDTLQQEFLADAISELESLTKKTNSSTVQYFLYHLKIERAQREKNFTLADQLCNLLLQLIRNSKALLVKRTLGGALGEFARNALYKLDYDQAINFSEEAAMYQQSNTLNYSSYREIQFYAAFYSGDMNLALSIIDELLNNTAILNSSFLKAKKVYLKACVHFVLQDYKTVHQLLQSTKAVEQDKEGWNVNVRILSIMNDIERNFEGIAGMKIENTRKHLGRISRFTIVRQRDIIIRKVLNELINFGLDFRKVVRYHSHSLEELCGQNEEMCWQQHSPELVIFHKWIIARAKGEKYPAEMITKAQISLLSKVS